MIFLNHFMKFAEKWLSRNKKKEIIKRKNWYCRFQNAKIDAVAFIFCSLDPFLFMFEFPRIVLIFS